MRSFFVSLALLLFVSVCANAKQLEGRVFKNGIATEVYMKVPTGLFKGKPQFEPMQFRIKAKGKGDEKWIRLDPREVDRLEFEYNGETYSMVSLYGKKGAEMLVGRRKKMFVRELVGGELSLYTYHYSTKTFSDDSFETDYEKYILYKRGQELMVPGALNFRKEVSRYISDKPHLSERVMNRELRLKDIIEIVKEYNR